MAVITVNAGWKTIGDARVVLNSDQQIAVNCGEAEVLITPLADDMVHIQIVRGVGSKHINSWAIAKEKWDLPKHELEQDEKSITITLKDMTVRLTKSPSENFFFDTARRSDQPRRLVKRHGMGRGAGSRVEDNAGK